MQKYPSMSVSVFHDKNMSAYLKKVTPHLQTYWDAIHKITNQSLTVHRTVPLSEVVFFVRVEVPVVFLPPFQFVNPPRIPNAPITNGKPSEREILTQLELVSIYNERLREYLFHYLSAEKELHKPGDLSRKVKKLTELKDAICEFSEIIDKIIEFYNVAALGLTQHTELPSLEKLKEQKKKVYKLKCHLNVNELHGCFGEYTNAFQTSDTNILCAILGFERSFGDWYDNELEPDLKMHQSLLYYLIESLREKEESLRCENKNIDLYKNLRAFGFTQERAQVIVDSIPPDIANNQLPSYWAERYLENAFLYHPLINDIPRYPYCPDKQNEWFEQTISTDQREEPEEDSSFFNIKIINLEKSCNLNMVESFLKETAASDADSVLLYHGTTHASAFSILTEGITLSKGKDGQDFSSGDGFYLSEKFENATKWSRGGRGNHFQAVVVFKVPKSLLDADAENGLDVCDNHVVWEEIIRLCRKKYNDKKAKKRLLNDVSFVRGPICKNPSEVVNGGRAQGFSRDDYQICIRDEDYSVKFGSLRNVCCVIFL